MMPSHVVPTGPVLIVEDDQKVATLFQRMLVAHHYVVRVEGDAEHALAALQQEVPSAILVDLHLPGEDGLAFMKQVRAVPGFSGVPAALVTGDYLMDESIARDLKQLGVRVYFKPLWEEDLLRAVRALLDH